VAPLVSVVIPVYNQGGFVGAAIESVLAQDVPSELIVVDDGSTDETPDVLDRFGDRLLTIRQPNRGAAAALNAGIRAAAGKFVCWLSADDRYLPGKLRMQVALLESLPSAGFSCTWTRLIDAEGRLYRPDKPPRWKHEDRFVSVFWNNPINGSSVMIRKALLDQVGYFDESLTADVDAHMWLRLLETTELAEVRHFLTEYRIHTASISANRPRMAAARTQVRRPYVVSGALERRLGEDSSRVLFRMALDFGMRGMSDLSIALLDRPAVRSSLPVRRQTAQAGVRLLGGPVGQAGRRLFRSGREIARRATVSRRR
jgi:glycosyltransferase involved in cell wall biosynthesis